MTAPLSLTKAGRAFVRAFCALYVVLSGGGGLAASISAAAAAAMYRSVRRRARASPISMGDPQSNRASPLFYSTSPTGRTAAESSSAGYSTEFP